MIAAIAGMLLAGCSSDNVEEQGDETVTLRFSGFQVETESMTRATSAIGDYVTKLDVWIYESGSEVSATHQSSSDAGFGSLSVTLNKTKNYTIYAVGHKADGATLTDGVVAFTDDKVTHSMWYTTTFSPATTTSLACEMTRIVADFRLEITDDIPTDAVKFRFTVNGVYDRWNVSTGGTHQLDRTSTINYNGTSAVFNVYAIVTDAQTTHDITVTALDENDQEVQTRTFVDVPLRNGYKTNYRGQFFTDAAFTSTFTAEDWNEYDTVDF